MMRKLNKRKRKAAQTGRIALCAVFFVALMVGHGMDTVAARPPLLAVSQLVTIAGLAVVTGLVVAATMR